MKKTIFVISVQFLFLLFLFFVCPAQQTAETSLAEARKAIGASNELFFQAFARGDSSLFIDLYTRDCWIMPPNAPSLCGPDAPLEFFKTAYTTAGVRNGRFITIDVYGCGREFVTEVGFWQLFGANDKPIDNGKFLVLWKKTANGWKMFLDSFNSDQDNRKTNL
jgi:ketosteroid isomerase-like protein